MAEERIATIERETAETSISVELQVDGTGAAEVDTGIPFVDHMLVLFARHGLFDLKVAAKGDLEVDYHHTVEDLGIVLGQVFKKALGDKKGINRYGSFYLPMDETLARVVVDIGGRPYLVYEVQHKERFVRDFNTLLFREFFQGFVNNLGCALHVKLEYGEEAHHVAEAIFKGFARTMDAATRHDPRQEGSLPSTKGVI